MDRTHHFYERRKNDLWHISNTLLCRPPPLFFFFWFSDLRHSEYCVLNDNGKSREHTANSGVHSRLTIRITAHMPPVRQIEFICLQMCAEEHAIVRLHCCGMSNRNVKRIDQSCLILLMRRRVHCFFLLLSLWLRSRHNFLSFRFYGWERWNGPRKLKICHRIPRLRLQDDMSASIACRLSNHVRNFRLRNSRKKIDLDLWRRELNPNRFLSQSTLNR